MERKVAQPFDVDKYVSEQVGKRTLAKEPGKLGPKAQVGSFLENAKAKLVDFTAPIEDVLNAATKKSGVKLLPSQDIHNQIDRALRAPTLAGQFVKDNGLVDVIRKVDNPDALDQYLIARHAIELDTRGVTTGRDIAKDTTLVKALGPKYEKEAATVVGYSRKLLDYSVDSGLISPELASALKERYPDYVPFSRVFTEIEKKGGGTGGGVASLSRQTAVQKIVGSEREVESPIESLLAKTGDVFKQGEKNKAAQLLAGYKDLPGNPFQLKEVPKGETRPHTISVFENGEKKVYETTPEIAQAAKSLNVQQLNILGKIFALPTRVARLGLTGINIPFIGANIVRDQATAFINSDRALKTSLANPLNFTRALFSALKHDELYDEMVRAGGAGTSFDISRNQVEQTVKGIRAGRNAGSKALYLAKNPGELLRAVEDIVGRAEEVARIQQYRGTKNAALKEGMDPKEATIEAARAARDTTINFARRGEWGTVLNSALLYMNAGIQGSRTFLRNAKNKPVSTAAKTAVAIFTPVSIATAWNLNDPKRKEAYEDIAEYEKENNLIIVPENPTKDADGKWNVIKIPLEQSTNNLASIVRRSFEAANGLDPISFGDIANNLVGTVSPVDPKSGISSFVPQAIKPSLEATVNKNLFTGYPIVPRGMENLSPENQVRPTTSGTARGIGKITGKSPIQTEAFIKSTFGGVGEQALNASDNAFAAAGVIPKEQVGGKSILEGIVGRFGKASGGETESKVYDALDKAAQEKADYKAKNVRPIYDQAQQLKAEGKEDEAQALVEKLSDDDYEIYKAIRTAEKSKKTKELQVELSPVYEQIQALIAEDRLEEAQQIVEDMTDEEYHAYELLKKKLQ